MIQIRCASVCDRVYAKQKWTSAKKGINTQKVMHYQSLISIDTIRHSTSVNPSQFNIHSSSNISVSRKERSELFSFSQEKQFY